MPGPSFPSPPHTPFSFPQGLCWVMPGPSFPSPPHTPFSFPQGLCWVMPGPRLLAVLASPSLLLLWDAQGGGAVVWKRDLAAPEVGVG